MTLQIIYIGLCIGAVLWLTHRFMQVSQRDVADVERQFRILAEYFDSRLTKNMKPLHPGQWFPPQIEGQELFIYIREEYGGNSNVWTYYTVIELDLPVFLLCEARKVEDCIIQALEDMDVQLYRSKVYVKGDILVFEMPILIYNEKIRMNFERIIAVLRRELKIKSCK